MTEYVKCVECKGDVPWYYAWVIHPTIQMHPMCAIDRWDEEGAGSIGPAIRKAYEERNVDIISKK